MSEALLVSNLLLWGVVVVLALVVLALARQVGVLHERLAPAGALLARGGLKVGEPSPVFEVEDLEGRPITIGAPTADARRTLLFFLSPTCPVCRTLLPTVLRVARSEAPPVRVVLASDGEPEEHRRYVAAHGLEGLPYVVSASVGIGFEVAKLPYAVLIDADGILRARGLINTREHLESLFEAERLGVASIQEWLANDGGGEREAHHPPKAAAAGGRGEQR